jgi:hypothetical protein
MVTENSQQKHTKGTCLFPGRNVSKTEAFLLKRQRETVGFNLSPVLSRAMGLHIGRESELLNLNMKF